VRLRIETVDTNDPHPNTYRLTLRNARETRSLIAVSTGGGMIEVIALDGFKVSLCGDCFETFLWVKDRGPDLAQQLSRLPQAHAVLTHESGGRHLVEVKAGEFLGDQVLSALPGAFDIRVIKRLSPVLPVLTPKDARVPFTSCAEMLRYDAGRNTPLWRLGVKPGAGGGGDGESPAGRGCHRVVHRDPLDFRRRGGGLPGGRRFGGVHGGGGTRGYGGRHTRAIPGGGVPGVSKHAGPDL
jgi:L-serine dehydratase